LKLNLKLTRPIYFALAILLAGFMVQKAAAEVEIDMGDQGTAAAPTATPMPQPTDTPVAAPAPTATVQEQAAPASQTAMAEPTDTPTPIIQKVEGSLHAKGIYDVGIKYYQEKDYDSARRYLQEAVSYRDKDHHTPKYIYAEAYATLGLIYQFYYPIHGHIKQAITYYKDALKYERNNHTAKKYLRKLQKHSN
jgi:tetratricopeptide (TPR) repeat protein